MPTVAQIVSLYPLAQYLSANDIQRKGLYAGGTNVLLPQKIRNIGDSVRRIYDATPNDDTLQLTANFLWTLCGIYGQQAQVVTQSSGTVSPITPPTSLLPYPIDWIVSGTASGTAPLATGETTVTFDGSNGMPDLRGYNMDFFRGSILQYTTATTDGSTYYSWNRGSGLFTLFNGAAQPTEQMRISPIG